MEKVINISDQQVKLNNNIGWVLAYRDQFGRDIIPAIMPMAAGFVDVVGGILEETGKTKNITAADILTILDGDRFVDAMVHLGSLELSDFINIMWALAKCADESIPEPKEWVKQFDEFPLDIIVPEVAKLILKGVVSSKNLKRLEEMKESLQPEKTTK